MFPNGISYIGDYALDGNYNLKRVTFGDDLQYLGDGVFLGHNDCPLEIAIHRQMPPKHHEPAYVRIYPSLYKNGSNPFAYLDTDSCILYVDAKSIELYKKAEYWKDFKNIRALPGTVINAFSVETTGLSTNKSVEVPISMSNDDEIIAFQCDVELSEGAEVVKDEYGDYEVTLSDRAHKTHTITVQDVDGGIRILAYSSKNVAFSGNEGALFTLPIAVNKDIDECVITIKNIIVTDGNRQEKSVPDVTITLPVVKAVPGDANGDGKVTITDITFIVDCIMDVENPDVVFSGADANGDGKVTVTDITEVIATIMSNQ